MQTLREVIAGLEKMTALLDEPVAFSLWDAGDVELYVDDFDTTDTPKEMWAKIADEFQNVLNSEWTIEEMNESIASLLGDNYSYKE